MSVPLTAQEASCDGEHFVSATWSFLHKKCAHASGRLSASSVCCGVDTISGAAPTRGVQGCPDDDPSADRVSASQREVCDTGALAPWPFKNDPEFPGTGKTWRRMHHSSFQEKNSETLENNFWWFFGFASEAWCMECVSVCLALSACLRACPSASRHVTSFEGPRRNSRLQTRRHTSRDL